LSYWREQMIGLLDRWIFGLLGGGVFINPKLQQSNTP